MLIRQLVALLCAMCLAFAAGSQVVSLLEQQRAPMIAANGAHAAQNIVTRLIQPATNSIARAAVAAVSTGAAPSETPLDEMAAMINALRVEQGLPPVKVNSQLSAAAQAYAQSMADQNFFGHNDPDHGCNKPYERMQAAGYPGWTHASENIAAGQASAQEAMDGFRSSPTHYKTLVNPNLREVGLGFVIELSDTDDVRIISTCPNFDRRGGPYLYYWVQDFASRQVSDGVPMLPLIINNEAFATESRRVNLYVYGGADGQPQWAQQMRFSDDGVNWSVYEPWQANTTYQLTGATGLRTVYVELKHIDAAQAESTQVVSDTIYLQPPNDPNLVAASFVFLPAMLR